MPGLNAPDAKMESTAPLPASASVSKDAPVLTLIDASGFIFRAYHAIQALSTSKGVPTNAVYGFTRMILKTLREFSPTHVALAFDKESRAGRQAIDPTYKANRLGGGLGGRRRDRDVGEARQGGGFSEPGGHL